MIAIRRRLSVPTPEAAILTATWGIAEGPVGRYASTLIVGLTSPRCERSERHDPLAG